MFAQHSTWLIDPRSLGSLQSAAQQARTVTNKTRRAAAENATLPIRRTAANKIAVLPLFGLLESRQSLVGFFAGGTDMGNFGLEFDAALADRSVAAIVLLIDSGGGSVAGTQELADKIYNARGRKPILALVDTLAASAAYWVGSAADKLYMTPSSEVGSVGALAIHFDESQALAKAGIVPTIIRSPKLKAEFNSFEPLTDEALAYEQATIDRIHQKFLQAVARNRGVDPATVFLKFGRGRIVDADHAVAHRMVDGIGTLETVIALAANIPRERQARDQHSRQVLKEKTLRVISGFCVLWNSPAWREEKNRWEAISPGAFDHILAGADEVVFCVDHRRNFPLAKRSEFGVTLEKTPLGLHITAAIPSTAEGRFLLRQIEAGEFTGWSFSHAPADATGWVSMDGRPVRLLLKADLYEISAILAPREPVYGQTRGCILIGCVG